MNKIKNSYTMKKAVMIQIMTLKENMNNLSYTQPEI